MNEATIRRLMENDGYDAQEIDDAIGDWAEEANQERSDRLAEERSQ